MNWHPANSFENRVSDADLERMEERRREALRINRIKDAALELLEACKAGVAYFERQGTPEDAPTFKQLRDAIQKAEAK